MRIRAVGLGWFIGVVTTATVVMAAPPAQSRNTERQISPRQSVLQTVAAEESSEPFNAQPLLVSQSNWFRKISDPIEDLFSNRPDKWPANASAPAQNGTAGSANILNSDSGSNDGSADISQPGPDMGDYPNSAYTLKKGRVQMEIAPASFRTQNANNSSAYATPFLFRYGLTDDVEFRILGTGLTSLISPQEVTGFGVLTFDTKIHLWDDQIERLIPAVSFEASLQTQIGSPAFQAGTEPAININMDFPFTKKTNFEATIGYSGNQTDLNLVNRRPGGSALHGNLPASIQFTDNVYVVSLQWAVEQEVTDTFSVFVHGYFAKPVAVFNDLAAVVGGGFFYQCSKRTMIFGSANAGLTDVPAPFLTQLGIAYLF